MGSKAERENTAALAEALEERLSAMLGSDLALDDVQRLRESVIPRKGHLPPHTDYKVATAAHRAIVDLPNNLDHIDSESELDDYAKLVIDLGLLSGATAAEMQSAQAAINARIARIREETPDDNEPVYFADIQRDRDRFDDEDLRNLFAPLIAASD